MKARLFITTFPVYGKVETLKRMMSIPEGEYNMGSRHSETMCIRKLQKGVVARPGRFRRRTQVRKIMYQ